MRTSLQCGGGGGKCYIIKPNASILGLFEENMDLILANQSLYYLPLESLRQIVEEFYALMNPGGVLFATMMSKKNGYFAHAGKPDAKTGLREVKISGRLNETSFIRFIGDAEELKELFSPFKSYLLGEYDPIHFYDFEGSAHHFIYVGVKE